MATDARTIEMILEQGAGAGHLTARKMFGEYGLFLDDKIVGLVCNDSLFLKVTDAGGAMIDDPHMAPPYPGAKAAFHIDLAQCEDSDWLVKLLKATHAALPEPKPKKAKKRGT
jgi:TfoX/Sxy family transcriptional regulator of competence genes